MVWTPVILTATVLGLLSVHAAYHDCGGVFKYEKISISGCSQDKICILHRGQTATLNITFIPTQEVKAVLAKVEGIIGGIAVPFPLPNPDGCKNSGLECPLEAGTQYTYMASIPVKRIYPKVTLKIKWELSDNKENILCALIDATLE